MKKAPFSEFEFGAEAITYIREELSHGLTLSTYLLALPLEEGSVRMYVPATADPSMILNFRSGGIGRVPIEWLLPSLISDQLTLPSNRYAVFESPMMRPTDPVLQRCKYQFFTHGEEIYNFLRPQRWTIAEVETTMEEARSWPFIGVLTSLPEGQGIAHHQDVEVYVIETLAARVEHIIVGAYDNSNDLVWSRPGVSPLYR